VTSVDVELGLTAVAAMLSPTTLSFSVFALVLGDRPLRTGLWFFLGAFGVTLLIGVVAAFVLGNAASPSGSSETPPTWVAILDIVFGLLLLVYVIRALRRPRDPRRTADMIEKMSGLASSPAVAIVAAGATLANPGGFIPIALKDISQLNPSAGEYIVLWLGFAIISLLPLLVALLALVVVPERATATLHRVRGWLERNARTLAAVIIVLLAAALVRNGIVALAS
jgi:hypothetical protein